MLAGMLAREADLPPPTSMHSRRADNNVGGTSPIIVRERMPRQTRPGLGRR